MGGSLYLPAVVSVSCSGVLILSVFISPSEPLQAGQCVREGQLAMQRAHSSVSCYKGGQSSDIQKRRSLFIFAFGICLAFIN